MITKLLSTLLLLPTSLILLGMIGLVLLPRHRSVGMILCLASLVLLAVLSTRAVAFWLMLPLERAAQSAASTSFQAQAIVILGSGAYRNAARATGDDMPSYRTLGRLRYAAQVQRQTGLPLLVSGGGVPMHTEAEVMASSLQDDFAVPVKWQERLSRDTEENAKFSAQILRHENIDKIILVTDALHMQRARRMFVDNGLQVIAVPTVFLTREPFTAWSFLPSPEGMMRTDYALHEYLGMVWYLIRH